MDRKLIGIAILGAAILVVAGVALAGNTSDRLVAKQATATFQQLAKAKAAGYALELKTTPRTGPRRASPMLPAAWGYMVNTKLLDSAIALARRGARYEPRGGKLQLVASSTSSTEGLARRRQHQAAEALRPNSSRSRRRTRSGSSRSTHCTHGSGRRTRPDGSSRGTRASRARRRRAPRGARSLKAPRGKARAGHRPGLHHLGVVEKTQFGRGRGRPPRVRTSSLRRIAETWWSTVRARATSPPATSALRMPAATSRSTRARARSGRPGSPGSPRAGPAGRRAPSSRSRCRDPRAPARPRAARARRAPRAARPPRRLGEGARRLVRAAASLPGSRGRARRRHRAGAGTARRSNRAASSSAPAFHASRPARPRTRGGASRSRGDTRPRLARPPDRGRPRARRLRRGRRGRAQALEVPARARELERLVESLARARVAAPCTHTAERDQRLIRLIAPASVRAPPARARHRRPSVRCRVEERRATRRV